MKEIPTARSLLEKHKEFAYSVRGGEWLKEELADWKQDVIIVSPNLIKISVEIGDTEETQKLVDFISDAQNNYKELIKLCEDLIATASTYRKAFLKLSAEDM